ncbi:hypothetical protein E1B28_001723 [Marasmius oreades]|uniref:Uncharacterized protein n=1 Tax=Marasmius oreades TaxID=181124 RepID=A0A9P8AG07_9AGAR|nr:uncharacterized protein E1B28_001723 [Marasmius oreades]KAG7099930.1 hypothetical protein E1B28_001723 [Marasmius oreades]
MNESTPLLVDTPIEPVLVSKDIYTYVPPSGKDTHPTPSSGPELILIFGWLDGKLSPLKRYMQGYRKLYPQATQVLIMSRKSSGWSRKSTNLNVIRPAIDIIQSHGLFGPSPPNMLVHVLSNGGGFQLLLASELMKEIPHQPPVDKRPATAIVFDSVPGEAGLWHALYAHTIGLSLFVKFLVSGPLILIYAAVMGWAWIRRQPSPFDVLREGLQDPYMVPFSNKRTPRLYIYSQQDQLVLGESVEKHMADAKARGLAVNAELFQGSSHVAHMRKDPVKYWDVIANHWTEAVKILS